mmetsp:Transcript_54092/g.99906  ORF Transcript_54092/g.99906 Transcript_54092/m.99906 type:complete len:167 (+) Transcript_54092:65-565(+)
MARGFLPILLACYWAMELAFTCGPGPPRQHGHSLIANCFEGANSSIHAAFAEQHMKQRAEARKKLNKPRDKANFTSRNADLQAELQMLRKEMLEEMREMEKRLAAKAGATTDSEGEDVKLVTQIKNFLKRVLGDPIRDVGAAIFVSILAVACSIAFSISLAAFIIK